MAMETGAFLGKIFYPAQRAKVAFVGSQPSIAFLRAANEMDLQVLPVADEKVPGACVRAGPA